MCIRDRLQVFRLRLEFLQILGKTISDRMNIKILKITNDAKAVSYSHLLVYYEGDEGYCFHDSGTKTDAGIRDIPMTQMVYDAFRKQREPVSYTHLDVYKRQILCNW